MLDIVRTVVVEKLNIALFIDQHKETIYEKLEQRAERASNSGHDNSDLDFASSAMFIAESLSLMSGVISVGATKKNFSNASAWFEENFPNAQDPTPLFLALTLIYITETGWNEKCNEKENKIWNKIHQMMKFLISKYDTLVKPDACGEAPKAA